MRLHRLPFVLGDDGGGLHDHMLGLGLRALGFRVVGVEAMLADIGRAGQDLVDGGDAPAPAIAGADVILVEMLGDGLQTHRAAVAVAA